jgi:hypothetical protein
MSAETFDILKIAALVAASFLNRQAVIVLVYMLIGEMLFKVTPTEFWFCIAAGAIYAINATVAVPLAYRIRQALIVTGCLYWLCALDAFLFPNVETLLYTSFGYLIGAVDLYVLWILLLGGQRDGRDHSSAAGTGNGGVSDLQLH